MPELTGSADPAGPRPSGMASYLWEAPGKALSIHLSLAVVERLDREVVQAFRAITSRGSEVGGILLGRVESSGKCTVVIEDCEPVACDYRRGPLYLMAEEDRQRLAGTLARWKDRPEKPRSIVGYYRSNTRKDLILDDDDAALIKEYFPAPENVFLLVKPFASKANQAGFFLWENGVLERQSAKIFPFRQAELAKIALATPAAAAAPAPVTARPPVAAPVATPPAARAQAAAQTAPAVVVKEVVKTPPRLDRPAAEAVPAVTDSKPAAAVPFPIPAAPAVLHKPEVKPVTSAPAARVDKPIAQPPKTERPVIESRHSVPVKPEPPTPVPVKPEKPAAEAKPLARQEKPAAELKPVVVPKPVESKPAAPVKVERPLPQPIPIRSERPLADAKSAAVPALARESMPPAAAPVPTFEITPPSAVARVASKLRHLARNRLVWIAATILLLVVVASSAILMRRGGAPGAVEDTSSLALKVDRNGLQLVLSWNRQAALLQTAQRAILSIGDGDHREDVELDLAQLRNGSIVYSPITSDVSFRLEVTDLKNGKSLAESVRALSGKPSPSVPTDKAGMPLQTAAAPPPATPAHPVPSHTPTGTAPAQPGSPPAADSAETTEAPAQRVAQPTRALTLPTPSGDSLAARLSAPEPMAPSGQAPQVNLPMGSTRPIAPPAPPPAEAKPAAAEAAKQAPPAKAEQPLRVGGAVQEAKLIRRREPVYPALARQARLQGVVKVSAVIGPDGKVVKVDAISGPPLLRQAAIDAVKQWVYQPSLLNGQPVQVETQIDVNFTLGR